MKLKFLIIIIIGFLISCSQSRKNNQTLSPSEKLKKEAVTLAVEYVKTQLTEAQTTEKNGIITISTTEKRYTIDPSETLIGLIDQDTIDDAIVSLTSYYKKEMGFSEQLFFIKNNGELILVKSIEDDIKILKLKDRIITAERHTKPRNSPLYDCEVCIEVDDYAFENGELVIVE